jgi:inositol monophosphatase 3
MFCISGYKTLEVIKGNQDAYVHTTLIKKWDICAGNAILSSLDGKMTTLDGKHIDYRSGDQPKNEGGLLATTYNHDTYLEKLSHLKNKS